MLYAQSYEYNVSSFYLIRTPLSLYKNCNKKLSHKILFEGGGIIGAHASLYVQFAYLNLSNPHIRHRLNQTGADRPRLLYVIFDAN
jgi:hypothetical protein